MNGCAKISANWFPENERIRATTFAFNSLIFGISIGTFIPSVFVTVGDESKLA